MITECATCEAVGTLPYLVHGGELQLASDDPEHTVEDVLERRREGMLAVWCEACKIKPRMDRGVCWRCIP